jgi:hypothetical protein
MFTGIEKFEFYGRKDYNAEPGPDNQESVGYAFHTYNLNKVENIDDLKKDLMDTIFYLLPEDYAKGREGKFITNKKLD